MTVLYESGESAVLTVLRREPRQLRLVAARPVPIQSGAQSLDEQFVPMDQSELFAPISDSECHQGHCSTGLRLFRLDRANLLRQVLEIAMGEDSMASSDPHPSLTKCHLCAQPRTSGVNDLVRICESDALPPRSVYRFNGARYVETKGDQKSRP